MSTILHKDLTGTDLHVNKLHASTHETGGTDVLDPTVLPFSYSSIVATNLQDAIIEVYNKVAGESLWNLGSGSTLMPETANRNVDIGTGSYSGQSVMLRGLSPYKLVIADGTKTLVSTTDLPTATTIGSAYIYRVGGNNVSIADGGTNADSFATSNGLLYYNGTALVADTAALTNTRIPFSGATGRLTDSANLTYDGTQVTTPMLTGGSAASSTLTLKSTSGTGTTSHIYRKTGANGNITVDDADDLGAITHTAGRVIYLPTGLTAAQINAYITAATAGDTLVLGAGSYTVTSSIAVNKKLKLKGQGRNLTTITASTAINNITVTASDSEISDMAITNTSTGYAIYTSSTTSYSGLLFENLDLTVNGTATGAPLGIDISSATVRNCKLSATSSDNGQAGIEAFGRATSTANTVVNVYDTQIIMSGAAGTAKGIHSFYVAGSFVPIVNTYNCTITTGGAGGNRYGVFATGTGAQINAYNCTISGASTDVVQASSAVLTLSNCTLANNTTSGTITYAGTVVANGIYIDGKQQIDSALLGMATLDSLSISAGSGGTNRVAAIGSNNASCALQALVLGHLNNTAGVKVFSVFGGNGSTDAFATERYSVTTDGNVLVGGTAAGTSGTLTSVIKSGTAPTTSPADAFQLNSADYNAETGKAAAHFRDEQGYVVPVCGEYSAQPYELAGTILSNLTAAKLICPFVDNAATEADMSGQVNTLTYQGTTPLTKRILVGRAWAFNFNGTDNYLTVADSTSLSFGNSLVDSSFSIGGWIEVVNTAGTQDLFNKWYNGGNQREYLLVLDSSEKLSLTIADESVAKFPRRDTDAGLSVGWHFIVAIYDVAVGSGATAADGMSFYVDGLLVASTVVTNDAAYLAMENGTASLFIGARSAASIANFFAGDMGQFFVTGEALTAAKVWQMYVQTRGYYKK